MAQPILYEAKLHWISYIRPIIYIILGSLNVFQILLFRNLFQIIALPLLFLLFKGIIELLNYKKTKIRLSNDYLSFSTGIFTTSIIDVSLNKMEGMQLTQSLFGKTLNYGRLTMTTGQVTQSFTISNPSELREKLCYYTKH